MNMKLTRKLLPPFALAGALALLPVTTSSLAAADSANYQELEKFMSVYERVKANYVDPVDDHTLIKGAIDGMLAALDPHSSYAEATDFDQLKTCTLPKFIIHGESDELISIKEIRKFYAQIPEPKELVTIEDADHLFEGKTSLVGETVEDLLADFNTAKA